LHIQQIAIKDFAPDITFLIDIDVEKTLKRVQGRKDNNRYEDMDLEYHRRVRSGFLEIAQKNQERIKVIDGNKSISQIHQEIIAYLEAN
jgi:dTMP kinase